MTRRRILGKVIGGQICLVIKMDDNRWCAFTITGKKLVAAWRQ